MSTAVIDAAPSGFRRYAVMVSTVMAATVYEINISSITVALPHMQGTFAATHDQVSWVVTAFIVGMTVMFACAGWLSDRFGRKQVFVACTAGFTTASFLCGAATSIEQEVLWRFLQGALGAPLMPLSQAIVLDSFPRERHGMANAIWGIAVMVGPASGPALGGLIVEHYAWPWAFFVNVPFGVAATVATWMLLTESKARTDRGVILIDREVELPAGAVRVAPLEDSVEGTVAFPTSQWDGRPAEGLVLRFVKGKVVDVRAAKGKDAVEAEMTRAGDAGRSFREFALGLNPLLTVPERGPWIPYYGYGAGVVRLSLGDNSELGGTVGGGYVRWNFFTDLTVTVGGTTWVKDGVLVTK